MATAAIIRRYLEWSGTRTLRRVVEQARAEIQWLRSQLVVASATNKRISDVNERFDAEIQALKEEIKKYRIIDPTMPCIACGSREPAILKAIADKDERRVVVQRTCKTCGFQQAHEPVSGESAAFEVWQPTPGEDELLKGGRVLGI